MGFSILTERELPQRLEPGVAALDWMDGDPPFDRRDAARFRRAGYPFVAPYRLFAVDGDAVLGKVSLLRLYLTGRDGRRPVTGIADVVADPAAHGRGVGRSLLERAHVIESARGVAYALLWTHVSWGAHKLYERLGYADVFSTPTAVHRAGARVPRLRAPYTIARVGLQDAARLDALHLRATNGRWGVLPRRASYRTRFTVGWRRPRSYRILRYRGRPVGYLETSESARHLAVSEAVLLAVEHAPALLDAAERLAGARWVTIGYTTFVREAQGLLLERGYHLTDGSHSVLMGRPLGRGRTVAQLRAWASDPRFSCQNGDRF